MGVGAFFSNLVTRATPALQQSFMSQVQPYGRGTRAHGAAS